jgi:DNA-binding response OmpR family regulator
MSHGSFPDARILIVEDDQDSVDMLTIWLTMHGYENVRSVTTADQAVPALIDLRPDLVLIDRHIGSVDGLPIVRDMVNASEGDPPAILVTSGDVSIGVTESAVAAGASEFVLKPYSPSDLIGKIENHLAVRFGRDATEPR